MQKDLDILAMNEKEGGGGGQQSSQENLAKNCYSSKFVPEFTGLFRDCLVQILNKFGAAALSKLFSRHSFTQTASSSSTAYATPIFALPMVALRYLFGAISSVFWNLCKTKSQQIQQLRNFIFSSRKKVAYLLSFVKDLFTIPTALLKNERSGVIFIILALFLPILLMEMKYAERLFERRQTILETTNNYIYYKKCAADAALAVAKHWNPGLTLGEQKQDVYIAAIGVYNSANTYKEAVNALSKVIPGFMDNRNSNITVVSPSQKQASYSATKGAEYVDIAVAPSEDQKKGKIEVKTDKDIAYAIPAECNIDIVLGIPINSNAAVTTIKDEAKNFIQNFCYTRGVYLGLIPYSGKLSLPQKQASKYTVGFPNLQLNEDFRWVMASCLYATKGTEKASLLTGYNWNAPYPIMFRRGAEYREKIYGNNPYYSCNFLNSAEPTNDSNKFFRMNLNPCGNTSFEATATTCTCAKTCPTFVPNPYCITFPTDDLNSVYKACDSLAPISDSFNKSNFIFMCFEWANNLLNFWDTSNRTAKNTIAGSDVSATLGRLGVTNNSNKKAVILIVNKPDHFEPKEMTYLGFSNDANPIEVDGSDTIDFTYNFGNSEIKSKEGSLKFSGNVSYVSGSYQCKNTTNCTLTCDSQKLVIITVEPIAEEGSIQFTNVTNTSDDCKVKTNTTYKVVARREFFIEPDMLPTSLGLAFNGTQLRLINAKITPNSWKTRSASSYYSHYTSSLTINCARGVTLKLTSTQGVSKIICKADFTNNDQPEILNQSLTENKTYSFSFSKSQLCKGFLSLNKAGSIILEGENFEVVRSPATFSNELLETGRVELTRLCKTIHVKELSGVEEKTRCCNATSGKNLCIGANDEVYEKLCNESTDNTIAFDKITKIADISNSEYSFSNFIENFLVYSKGENAICEVKIYGSGSKEFNKYFVGNSITIPFSYTPLSGIYYIGGGSPFDVIDTSDIYIYPIIIEVKPTVTVKTPESMYIKFINLNGTENKRLVAPGASWEKRFTPSNIQYTGNDSDGYTLSVETTFEYSETVELDDYLDIYTEKPSKNSACSISINSDTATIFTNIKKPIQFEAAPVSNGYIKFGDSENHKVSQGKTTTFSLFGYRPPMYYTIKNAKITKVLGATSTVGTYQLTDKNKCTKEYTLPISNPYGIMFTLNNDNSKVKVGYTRKILGISSDKWETLENRTFKTFYSDDGFYEKCISGTKLSFITKNEIDNTADVTISIASDLTASVTNSYIPAGTNLEVTIEGTGTDSAFIQYKKADGSWSEKISIKREKGLFGIYHNTTVKLYPATCYYKPVINGYIIDLKLQEIADISDLEIITSDEEEDAGNIVIRDAVNEDDVSKGVKLMSQKYCEKLKATYGNNARIYLVKYQTSSSDDFSYFGNCIYSTHEAKDKEQLKSTLDGIAADLKSWAGYQEARVVK